MESITLHVTQEDIDTASRKYFGACVINTALKRQFGPNAGVVIYGWGINDNNEYETTKELQEYIYRWDTNKPVEPRDFILPLKTRWY